MKKVILILILLFFINGCGNSNNSINNEYISPNEVYELIGKDDTYIIDVRDKDEYDTGHIKGSINIPVGEIDEIYQLVSDKDSLIIVYCKSGARSRVAYSVLKSFGYRNVLDMKGINEWNYELEEE